jgi:hypothetical protein
VAPRDWAGLANKPPYIIVLKVEAYDVGMCGGGGGGGGGALNSAAGRSAAAMRGSAGPWRTGDDQTGLGLVCGCPPRPPSEATPETENRASTSPVMGIWRGLAPALAAGERVAGPDGMGGIMENGADAYGAP